MQKNSLPSHLSPSSISEYYWNHLGELTDYSKFHFLTRNFLLKQSSRAKQELDILLFSKDTTHEQWLLLIESLTNPKQPTNKDRIAYLQQYPTLRQTSRACFARIFGEKIWGIDYQNDFLSVSTMGDVEPVWNTLMQDTKAISCLATYALNFLFLENHFFHFQSEIDLIIHFYEIYDRLTEQNNSQTVQSDALTVQLYFLTHTIINDSLFYTRPIPEAHRQMHLDRLSLLSERIIHTPEKFTTDALCEFVAVYTLLHRPCPTIQFISSYLASVHSPEHQYLMKQNSFMSLSEAEHSNVLYICGWSALKIP
ncbi:hypothetical protein KBC79_04530 [Candidatus Woesebacteria bacterium]|nr:hypothetical protein [Candidatus Woesebacteria bacterium]